MQFQRRILVDNSSSGGGAFNDGRYGWVLGGDSSGQTVISNSTTLEDH
jgi:hypothetical protein